MLHSSTNERLHVKIEVIYDDGASVKLEIPDRTGPAFWTDLGVLVEDAANRHRTEHPR